MLETFLKTYGNKEITFRVLIDYILEKKLQGNEQVHLLKCLLVREKINEKTVDVVKEAISEVQKAKQMVDPKESNA